MNSTGHFTDDLDRLPEKFLAQIDMYRDMGSHPDAADAADAVVSDLPKQLRSYLEPRSVDGAFMKGCKELNRLVAVSGLMDGSNLSQRDRDALASAWDHMDAEIRLAEYDRTSLGGHLFDRISNEDEVSLDEAGRMFYELAENRMNAFDPESPNDRLARRANDLMPRAMKLFKDHENFPKIKETVAICKRRIHTFEASHSGPAIA